MNGVDTAILAVLGISSLIGVWRGLIREMLSLLAWAAAFITARLYADGVSGSLAETLPAIDNESLRYVLSFALIFLAVLMLGALLSHLVASLMSLSGMRPMDRILGGLFGVLRGAVLVVAVLFLTWAFFEDSPQWRGSLLIPYGEEIIEFSRLMLAEWPGWSELPPLPEWPQQAERIRER